VSKIKDTMKSTNIRIGNGYDIHPLEEGFRFVLGGVEIKHHKGCPAHSDGDVVIHALCDAILGALALGDIGIQFPDDSPIYKDIDSRILLSRVVELMKIEGYVVGNADITIALQKPKIADMVQYMRETIASLMFVEINQVSVKATTTEKLGFVGREEGVEAFASVLLYKEE
jgi:2-C-methyl-D-erythritol 2,4-cyclodiphosphate synthase